MTTGNSISIDALRQEVWSKALYKDIMADLFFMENAMMGKDDNNIVQVKDDLAKQNGDAVTFGLTTRLAKSGGVSGDSELEGHEQAINAYSESILISQWRDAVRLAGRLDEQKNAYDMRSDAKQKLKVLGQEWLEQQFFLKLAGVNNTSLTDIAGEVVGTWATWSNTPSGLDATDGEGARRICANSSGGASLASTDIMTTTLIDRAKLKAQTASPKIKPLRVNGKKYYVMFLHPHQAYDLKQNPIFNQARREAEIRGPENPIFTGALGIWNGVILHEHDFVPFLDISVAGNCFTAAGSGTDYSADAYRAILCGQQAVGYAKCEAPNGWVEKDFDYNNKTGFSMSIIGGIDKIMFNSKEYGCIVVDTASSITVS